MDIIAHCIEEDAIDSHSCTKCPDCLWVTKPIGLIVVAAAIGIHGTRYYTPLSPELKNMSPVDHFSRNIILQKVILDMVALYDCNQTSSTLSCL